MNRTFPYRKVNAFTGIESGGNPAAYMLLGEHHLTPQEMLSVGKEHAGFVSEVVFAEQSESADCKLTYYSSECEVEFCGHGTIATMYDMICRDPALRAKPMVRVETNCKGTITVFNHIETEDAIYITSPEIREMELPITQTQAAEILGIPAEQIDTRYPMDFIEAGLRTLIVPISKLSDEISIWPDEAAMREFNDRYGIEDFLIFCMETADDSYLAHSRVFAPKFGYLEDPATGSANSAFARYLLKNRLWDGTPAALEQGGEDRIFNTVKIAAQDGCILFGGRATVKINGEYYL